MGAKAAMLLAMLWLWPLSEIAYSWLLTLNDMQVGSSNLGKEDSILKHYAEILQQMALRVPTQGTRDKKEAVTRRTKSSKSKKTKHEAPLMKHPAWFKGNLEPESSIRCPREQDKKEQERTISIATTEAPGNTEEKTEDINKDLDNSDMENLNLEDDDSSVLEIDESDSEENAFEDPPVKKSVASTLGLAVKMAMDPTQLHHKPSLDSALKLIEEASQQVKPATPGRRVIVGQMALVAPLAMDYPGTQVHNLGTGISQPSEEAKDQQNKEQVIEDQILKKISDINKELKRALKNAKSHIEFKDDVESAKKYGIQSFSLVERENTSSSGHKPQKFTKEKDNDERIRLFINFLYDFKSQLTVFLNMNNIPFDLQGKAATVFNTIEAILCGNQQKRENTIKELLQDNIRMLNMLNITVNP
ncbi:sperm equatorial segment protein 1 [Vombatus ursinus]|uniref:sperm equatorial segment protein 1 n=1 Tax=Vombatus ursinus TaxID=29139 RepID=UPI000FFD9C38|nr:sperm equatorial segment protein 1 [Vombatus ursinus]